MLRFSFVTLVMDLYDQMFWNRWFWSLLQVIALVFSSAQPDVLSLLMQIVGYLLECTVGMTKQNQIIKSRSASLLSSHFLPKVSPGEPQKIDKAV